MLKRLLASKPVIAFLSTVASGYIRLIYATSTIKHEPEDIYEKLFGLHPQVVAIWHGQFMLQPKLKPTRPAEIKAMVSRHGDAELLGSVLQRFGTELIRGAGAGQRKRDRGGATAMRETLRALQAGATVVMTADVPPGPARRAGVGIATIGAKSGRPVVPIAIATRRFISLPTWSAFTINLPFSTLSVVVGDPVSIPDTDNEADIETGRQAIEAALAQTTERAYALVGATDPLDPIQKAKPGLPLKLYRFATRLAAPVAPLLLSWRTAKGKEEPEHRPERYGIAATPRPPGFLAWFHAASVGEVNAALPVIDAIAQTRADVSILLTTATVTSARLARKRLPEGSFHQYVPLDREVYLKRFLDHWKPDLAVLVESEIWPNLVLDTKARDIPLLLINGRMSNPSFRGWRRRPGMSRPIFSAFDVVLAQNALLAERFAQLGANKAINAGNLKADAPPPPIDETARAALLEAVNERPVWVAASTHPGEEEIVATAHSIMTEQLPGLLTIIVPRHPERGAPIAAQLAGDGLTTTLRSSGALPDDDTDVYVADTIGELGLFYTLAPVALIGNSIQRKGGQNPVEAVKLGTAVVTGPNYQNFTDTYSALLKAGGARQVTDAESLAETVQSLLQDEPACEAMRASAEGAVAGMGGALTQTLEAIDPFLPPRMRPRASLRDAS